ncbi:MAG: PQQ-binding-like beta-propeller repeat protein [Planctomycetota bacterium]
MTITLSASCAACDELLPPYYDGDLEPTLSAQVITHLTHCSRCTDALVDLSLAMGALHRIPQPTLGDLSAHIAHTVPAPPLRVVTPWRWQSAAVFAAAAVLALAASVYLGYGVARRSAAPLDHQLQANGLVATNEGWLSPSVLRERQSGRVWLNGRWTDRVPATERMLAEQGHTAHPGAWLNKDAETKLQQDHLLTPIGWTPAEQVIADRLTKQGLARTGASWIDAKDVQGLRRDGSIVTTDQVVGERLVALGYVRAADGAWRLAEEERHIAKGEIRVGDSWTTAEKIAEQHSDAMVQVRLAAEGFRRDSAGRWYAPADRREVNTLAVIPAGWNAVAGVPNVARVSKPSGTPQAALSSIRAGGGASAGSLSVNVRQIVPGRATTLTGAWIAKLPEAVGGTPAVVAGRVHLKSGGSTVSAVDAVTGRGIWLARLSDTTPSNPVGYGDEDVAYTTGSCTLYALSGKSGGVQMNAWIWGTLSSMPLAHGDLLLTTKADEHGSWWLAAMNGKSGRTQWAAAIPSDVRTGIQSAGTQLLCTTRDGTLIAWEGNSGREVWRRRIASVSPPAPRGGDIFIRRLLYNNNGAIGESTAVLDAANGNVRIESFGEPRTLPGFRVEVANSIQSNSYAEVPEGSELTLAEAPAPLPELGAVSVSGMATIVLTAHVVEARSIIDGRILWRTEIPTQGMQAGEHTDPVVVGNLVIMGCLDGSVRALDMATGDISWSLDVGSAMGADQTGISMLRCQPTVVSGRVYVTTLAGELVCIDTGNRAMSGPRWWGDNG